MELERFGSALREAETKGIPWDVDEGKPKAKHLPKAKNRFTKISPSAYVVPGDDPEKPHADLKRPWEAVARRAGLDGVRLHDLRHTYASFGAGGGLGLPIIGKLLGHTQASTTQRYAHLDADASSRHISPTRACRARV